MADACHTQSQNSMDELSTWINHHPLVPFVYHTNKALQLNTAPGPSAGFLHEPIAEAWQSPSEIPSMQLNQSVASSCSAKKPVSHVCRRVAAVRLAACAPTVPDTGPEPLFDAKAYLQARLALHVDKELSSYKQRDIEPSIELLLSIQSAQRVSNLLRTHPELLGVQLDAWQAFLSAYGISQHSFFKLLSTNAQLFIQGSLFTAGQNMMYLQSLGLSTRDISAHVIPRAAEVLTCHFATTLLPVVTFLTAPLPPTCPGGASPAAAGAGQGASQVDAQVEPHPDEASTDMQALINLQEAGGQDTGGSQVVQYGLGLSREQLRSLISRCPRVLLMSVQEGLQPKLDYLTHQLKLSGEQARTMLDLNSCLLLQPVEPLLHSHITFLERTCGFSHQEALNLLVTCPDLIVFSTGNLDRKWQYISKTVFGGGAAAHTGTTADVSGGDAASADGHSQPAQQVHAAAGQAPTCDAASQARAAVLDYPSSLSHSLLNDIGPRYSYARDRGLLHHLLEYNEQAQGVMLSLRRLLASNTVSFVSAVNGDEADFQRYCRQWRRNEAGRLTLTSSILSESSW